MMTGNRGLQNMGSKVVYDNWNNDLSKDLLKGFKKDSKSDDHHSKASQAS